MRKRSQLIVTTSLSGILFLFLFAGVEAQHEENGPGADELESLISRLSDQSWHVREQAQEELVQYGEVAAPRLEQLLASTIDAETRTRAQAALDQIAENRLIGPSIITLDLRDAAPEAAFAELARQAETEFDTRPEDLWTQREWPALTLNIDRKPFWEALRMLCDEVGVFPQQLGMDQRMTLMAGPGRQWAQGLSYVHGPFLVVATRIHRSTWFDLSRPEQPGGDFQIQFSIMAEPKLRIVQGPAQMFLEEVVDDHGNSLLPPEARPGVRSVNMRSGQGWTWGISARLNYPDNPGQRITRFRGRAFFTVQTRSQILNVPEILSVEQSTHTVAGRRVLIHELKESGEQYELRITFFRDGLPEHQWQQLLNPQHLIRLLDEQGRPLAFRGGGGGGGGQQRDFTYHFMPGGGPQQSAGKPHRLVLEVPLEVKEIVVPIELDDIPLP